MGNSLKKSLSWKNMTSYGKNSIVSYGIIIIGFIVITLLDMAGFISSSLQGQLVPICAYIVMAISLNLVVGISGELSLGHAGFMSIGAFSGIITSFSLAGSVDSNVARLIIVVIVGGIFAGIAGILIGIPVLRLRGDYLAIVTLAFGEIIKNILNCVYAAIDTNGLHFSGTQDGLNAKLAEGSTMILSGPMGATGNERIATFFSGIVLCLVALFVVQNLINSKQGRAIMAIRDNRIAAESIGLSITKYKMRAFVTSAILAGMAGALFAMNYSSVAPVKFRLDTSILILVFVVLGGIGNIAGGIIAATVLTILPEALRQFSDYRMITYAVVLILVMLGTNSPSFRAFLDVRAEQIKGLFRKKPVQDNDAGKEVSE